MSDVDDERQPIASVVWWDIECPSPEAFQQFHGALSGWTFLPAEFQETELSTDYWIIKSRDGDGIGGLQQSASDLRPQAGVRLYLRVDDLETTLEQVRSLGGTVERNGTELGGDDGRFAVVQDPAGISFGLWSESSTG